MAKRFVMGHGARRRASTGVRGDAPQRRKEGVRRRNRVGKGVRGDATGKAGDGKRGGDEPTACAVPPRLAQVHTTVDGWVLGAAGGLEGGLGAS